MTGLGHAPVVECVHRGERSFAAGHLYERRWRLVS